VVATGALTAMELFRSSPVASPNASDGEWIMTFGRGFLLWIIGIPLPIILLLALFWHH
jgi:hypothetical protein